MFETLVQEFGYKGHIALPVLGARLAGAILLCGLIGLEREVKKDTAGLRTNMLIGLAAAAFALATLHLMHIDGGREGAVRLDPIRLVEAVTAGVAFLAGGVVIFARGNVRGLTTAASMWLSAAIGLCAGLGYWWLAVMVSLFGLLILIIMRRVEIVAGMKED